jgi:hypothetical protein
MYLAHRQCTEGHDNSDMFRWTDLPYCVYRRMTRAISDIFGGPNVNVALTDVRHPNPAPAPTLPVALPHRRLRGPKPATLASCSQEFIFSDLSAGHPRTRGSAFMTFFSAFSLAGRDVVSVQRSVRIKFPDTFLSVFSIYDK